jgi:hypothetical protein
MLLYLHSLDDLPVDWGGHWHWNLGPKKQQRDTHHTSKTRVLHTTFACRWSGHMHGDLEPKQQPTDTHTHHLCQARVAVSSPCLLLHLLCCCVLHHLQSTMLSRLGQYQTQQVCTHSEPSPAWYMHCVSLSIANLQGWGWGWAQGRAWGALALAQAPAARRTQHSVSHTLPQVTSSPPKE